MNSPRISKPFIVAIIGALTLVLGATAGSLTPPGAVSSTMHSLANIYDSIASATFDSSGIVANQNGSLMGNLKYIESQLGWASVSNNLYYLGTGNVGIGTTNIDTKFEVNGTASVSQLYIGGTLWSPAGPSSLSATLEITGLGSSLDHIRLTDSGTNTSIALGNRDGDFLVRMPSTSGAFADEYAALRIASGSGGTIFGAPARPKIIGSVAGGSYVSSPFSVFAVEKYAYVTGIGNGLSIFDISNPASPTAEGRISGSGAPNYMSFPSDVFVAGKYAYVAAQGDNSLTIIDVSNPSAPVFTGKIAGSGAPYYLSSPEQVYVSGRYAYVTSNNDNSLTIIDVSNPASPSFTGKISGAGAPNYLSDATGIYVSGNYAYVAAQGDDSLTIIDVTNPSTPRFAGKLAGAGAPNYLNSAYSVYVSGKYAYVAAYSDNSLVVVDVSNPSSPVLKGTISGTSNLLGGARGVYVSGNYAYVAANSSNALVVVDVSNPANPTITSKLYDTGAPTLLTGAIDVMVSGKYAYLVSAGDNSLVVVDTGGIDTPSIRAGSFSTSTAEIGDNMHIGNNLYVRNGGNFGPGGLLVQGFSAFSSASYFGGNVGIGTTSPQFKLEIGTPGDVNLASSGAAYRISGNKVLWIKSPGSNSDTMVGVGAGENLTSGLANTFIGYLAGNIATSSSNNTFIGNNAGQLNRTGNSNLFIGRQAGVNNTYGSNNVFLGGFNAGANNTTGSNNVFIGQIAGQSNSTGLNNTFIGAQAGQASTTGFDNTSLGVFAGQAIGNGNQNTYIGTHAGRNATGNLNTFIGGLTGLAFSTGGANTLLGFGADTTSATASGSVAIGYSAKITASHQLVFGSGTASGSLTDAYFGQGVASVSPAGITLNATGGSGTDNPGAPLRFAGGKATGNALGGSILFQTSDAGGSGSTLQSLTTKMILTAAGNVGIGTTTPDFLLDVNGVLAASVSGNADLVLNNSQNHDGLFRIRSIGGATTSRLDIMSSASASLVSIASTGYVGIGTTAPITQLHVPGLTQPKSMSTTSDPNAIKSIYVQGRYAYVPSIGVSGLLRIFDITNPAAPAVMASISLGAQPYAITVQGQYAYVVDATQNNMRILNISNPQRPTLVSTTTTGTQPKMVVVQGRYAYVTSQTSNLLQVIDVANPAAPVIVGSVGIGSGTTTSLAVQGRYAYIGNASANTLQVVDINNPASPAVVRTVATAGNSPQGIAVEGRYLYLAETSGNQIEVFDVSNPQNASSVTTVSTGASSGPFSVFIQDRILYVVTNTSSTLQMFDISNPALPVSFGSMTTATGPSYVFVQSRYAYIGTTQSKIFQIVDLGGSYIQQLETGGLDASRLTIRGNSQMFNNMDIGGGLVIGRGLQVTGPVSFTSSISGAYNPFVFDATGNIGIGTRNPETTLEIVGTASISGITYLGNVEQSTYTDIRSTLSNPLVIRAASTHSYINFINSRTNSVGSIGWENSGSGGLSFINASNVAQLKVTATGLVGIGTQQIESNLEILGTATTGSVASISATTLVGGTVFNISVPASSSTNNAHGLMLVTDTNGITIASWSMGGTLALRGSILSHGAQAGCLGTNDPSSGCIDYAESYPTTDSTLAAGEVVAVDPHNPSGVIRASNSASVLGIISTNPAALITGIALLSGANTNQGPAGTVPVALAGRVPVKLTGSVAAGDHLALSDTPGVAQKATTAGMTIGIALENSSGPTVLTFVNTSYWAPAIPVLPDAPQSDGLFAIILDWFKSILGIEFGQGSVKVQKLCVGSVCVTEEQFMQVFGNGASTPADTPTATPTAEPSSDVTPSPDVTPTESVTTPEPSASDAPTPTPEATPDPVTSPPVETVPTNSP